MNKVNYQIHSDSEHKPWLMLIHGLFGSLDNLSALRRQFTDTYQVISIDLPDHGKSAFTPQISFELYANRISELLNDLEIKHLTLVGHSLGGKVAMQLALNQTEKVSRLVVLDIAPVKYSARHNNVFAGLNNVDLKQITSRKEADSALSQYVEDGATRQFLLKSLYNQDQSWGWRFNLKQLQHDYAMISAAITSDTQFLGPVLFIKGEHSDYILPQHKQAVLQLFPNSEYKMVSGTGHWLHAEKPELCGKIISAFLSK
ncbi:MAG: alpha/beta fold hydrolase [Paraglaciecola sp.]|uniref:alpha/beta fold hydrolase n=1 Tax=Paraglaciecola sp. TaxID=1920173 RepID=UPI0032989F87